MSIRPLSFQIPLECADYAPGAVVGKNPLLIRPSREAGANGAANRLTDLMLQTLYDCTLHLYLFSTQVKAQDGQLFRLDTTDYLGRLTLKTLPLPGGIYACELHNLSIPLYARDAAAGYLARPEGSGKPLKLGTLAIIKLCVED